MLTIQQCFWRDSTFQKQVPEYVALVMAASVTFICSTIYNTVDALFYSRYIVLQ